MATLAEIRARLAAAENKGGQSNGATGEIYPHWNIQDGESCLIRFLPDGNTKNTFFWQERQMIRLPFNGIKGEMDSKQVMVQVPCVEMWNDPCPVLAEVRTWFKDKGLEDMGRKYWKKRSYIFQGFVRENPMNDDKTPDNPIRRFIIGPQIFTIIKSALMDPELEELPTDVLRGLDFRISKTSKGGYADYNTSKWARKESALTEAEQTAIAAHGLVDMSTFMPKKPTDVELKAIKEMFDASVNGEPYDTARWGQYYRPAGLQQPAGGSESTEETSAAPAAAKVGFSQSKAEEVIQRTQARKAAISDESDEEPVATKSVEPLKPANSKAEDILAMIRARQKA